MIRGLRACRPGLVENQQQFEFCHRALEEALQGRGAGEDQGDGGQKAGRWKLFGGKRKKKNSESVVGFLLLGFCVLFSVIAGQSLPGHSSGTPPGAIPACCGQRYCFRCTDSNFHSARKPTG